MEHTKAIFGLGALAVGVALSTTVLASSGPQQDSGGLKRVAAPSAPSLAPVQVAAPQQQPAASWRDSLSAAEFGARAEAFDQAVAAVPHDATLRTALEEWADNKKEGELSWTAYMILREAKRTPASPLFGAQDPFQDFFGGGDPFAGLFPQGLGATPFGGQLQGGLQQEAQSFQLETTPDGVKVHVEKEGPNGTETQEFEAESLDELKALHPELFADQGLQVFSGSTPGGLFGRGPQGLLGQAPQLFGRAPFGQAGGVRTDVLGVMIREVGTGDATSRGLLVDRVLPGTIAESVGLQEGDIVVRVAGARVRTSADVKAALQAREADEGVVVEWVDSAGTAQTGTWKPAL